MHREYGNLDALKGLSFALRDQKNDADAEQVFRDALRVEPGHDEIQVIARARDGRFWARDAGSSRPLFVKGVNMGVALPGRFPAEFPQDESVYASLLHDVAGMGANAVRLYTLLPPGDLTQPSDLPMYTWRTWEQPTYHLEKKEAWTILKEAFASLPSHAETR